MRKLYSSFIFVYSLFFLQSFSQQNYPIGFAPGEELLMDKYLKTRASSAAGITTPPASPVRTMAEWEEVQAIAITWTSPSSYSSTLIEIIKKVQNECNVIIACTDSNSVKNTLTNSGVPLINIKFVIAPSNALWIRDYGPNSVYKNDVDSLYLVDWIYNRVRPKDDTISNEIARYMNVPLYTTTVSPNNLMNTGGNFMTDGFGNAFASKLVLDENDGNGTYSLNYPNHTEAEIDTIMKKFMGINQYIKMNTLPYDGIHHIDMHMKLLDEETLLVGEYPQGTADGPQIEANLQYVLSNFNSMFGTPYKVVRIVQPPASNGAYPPSGAYRTYANSVIANKTVLIPTFEQKYDTTALRIYRENMPGYNVVGINCNSIIQAGGALHCITHEIGADEPLLISHQPLKNTNNTAVPYEVNAYINHISGIASAAIFYTIDTSLGFAQSPMMLTNPANNTWTGFIVEMPAGTTIYYYIAATANSGKTQVRPLTAPNGFWKFEIIGDLSVNGNFSETLTLEVFPNPAGAITCIPVKSRKSQKATIKLFDVLGKEILIIYNGEIPQGETKFFFDASQISKGAYLLILDTEDGKRNTQKLMVK